MAEDLPAPLQPNEVIAYLSRRGYHANAEAAVEERPQLQIYVNGHDERDGHTWYNLNCTLTVDGCDDCHWNVQRRLLHMRGHLHDPVKLSLQDQYPIQFAHACFASRGGFLGTTSLLRDWSAALAKCINEGHAKPELVALVLRFLDSPEVCNPDVGMDAVPSEMRRFACSEEYLGEDVDSVSGRVLGKIDTQPEVTCDGDQNLHSENDESETVM